MNLKNKIKKNNLVVSGFVMVYVWMLSRGKMRLFRRRPSISEPQTLAIYPLQCQTDDQCKSSATENERQILDDSNYQTVKALPAVVLATHSPKTHKKGHLFISFIVYFINYTRKTDLNRKTALKLLRKKYVKG